MWKKIFGIMFVLAFLLSNVARAEPVLDTRFGNAGTVELPLVAPGSFGGRFSAVGTRVAVLPDRRIAVAVLRGYGGNLVPNWWSLRPSLAVTRLLQDGSVDPTFGNGAPVDLNLLGSAVDAAHFHDVHARADGSLYALITLYWDGPGFPKRLILVSVTADGRHDPAFNGGAPLILAEAGYNRAKVFDTGSGYLVVGTSRVVGPDRDRLGFDAWRRRADGTPDTTFGSGGSLVVTGDGTGQGEGSIDAMLLPNGGFQVLSIYSDGSLAKNNWRRYRSDGTVDTAFGNGGVEAIADVNVVDEMFSEIHPLGDGTYAATYGFTCVRRTLDAQGRTLTKFNASCIDGSTWDAAVQPYGRNLLVSSPAKLKVLDRDGSLDAGFAGQQGTDWSPSPAPAERYWSAADGDRGIVLAAERGSSVVVQRYVDVRGSNAPGQPIPALGLPGLLLVLGGAAVLARRRLAHR